MLDLVLLRHGQSTWNAKNLFTGWVDVDLTEKGEQEAHNAGLLLAGEDDLDLRVVHTSLLTRAIRTAEISLHAANRSWISVRRSWRLNERHYGDLQGKDKIETRKLHGDEQLQLWRRSFNVQPPPLSSDSEFSETNDPRYRDLSPNELPTTECLADVLRRCVPYLKEAVIPDLKTEAQLGGAVLVVAHGNSIRAIRKYLEGISETDITGLEIPTGIPFRYLLDEQLQVVKATYLGDPDAARAAAEAVARQAG